MTRGASYSASSDVIVSPSSSSQIYKLFCFILLSSLSCFLITLSSSSVYSSSKSNNRSNYNNNNNEIIKSSISLSSSSSDKGYHMQYHSYPSLLHDDDDSNSKNEKEMNNANDNKKEDEKINNDDYPCNPKHIHISQYDNVNRDHGNVSMVISFSLDYELCKNNTNDNNNNTVMVVPKLYYRLVGQKEEQEADVLDLKQFNYTSPEKMVNNDTHQSWESDWIYHMKLNNIQAGRKLYYYRIVVLKQLLRSQSPPKQLQQPQLLPQQSAALYRRQRRLGGSIAITREGSYVNDNNAHDKNSDCDHGVVLDRDHRDTPDSRQPVKEVVVGWSMTTTNCYNDDEDYNDEDEKHAFLSPPIMMRNRNRSHQDSTTATTIAFVGDLGQTNHSIQNMKHIFQNSVATTNSTTTTTTTPPPISLLMIAGDMSYADTDLNRWYSWFDVMEPLLRKLPVAVAAGNHEIECDEKTKEIFVPYENFFYNPNRFMMGDAETKLQDNDNDDATLGFYCATPSQFTGFYNYGNSFYSFQHGLTYIIVLNSYTQTHPESKQYQWLLQELEYYHNHAVSESLPPWLIVVFHCPFYTTFLGHNNETQTLNMKRYMEPLFIKYKVNMVISGHDHAYMRTIPITNIHDRTTTTTNNTTTVEPQKQQEDDNDVNTNNDNENNKNGPIYLTLGAGGNRENHSRRYLDPDQQEWFVAKRDITDYGYGNIYFENATHALLKFIRVIEDNNTETSGSSSIGSNDDDDSGIDDPVMTRDDDWSQAPPPPPMEAFDHVWIENYH